MPTKIENQTFTGQTVEVDGKWFSNCQFFNCILTYKGGEYGWDGTTFDRQCVWKFDGCAQRTVGLLHSLNMLKIESLTDLDRNRPSS